MTLKLTLNIERLFEIDHMVADPNPRKWLTKKRLIFLCQKIIALALHTESLELGSAPPVKYRKFERKIDFWEIFSKTKKILRIKMTRKKISTRWLKNIDTHF
jgi:hypothetical protein